MLKQWEKQSLAPKFDRIQISEKYKEKARYAVYLHNYRLPTVGLESQRSFTR